MSKPDKIPKDRRYDTRHNRGTGKQPKGYVRQSAVWPIEVTIRERIRNKTPQIQPDKIATVTVAICAPSYSTACKKWANVRRSGWLTTHLEALTKMEHGRLSWTSYGVPTLPLCFVHNFYDEQARAFLDLKTVRYYGSYAKHTETGYE